MIIHNLNPTIFHFGFFQLRYYSIFYIIGLIIGYYIILGIVKKKKLKLDKDDVMDYIVYIAIGLLAGGRIFYFVFYDTSTLWNDPLEVFKLWHGGMSFHGGVIGVIIAVFLFSKKYKINFWELADITVIPIGLALALGRIGNFINGELYGRVWNGFFCVDYTHNEYLNFLPKQCRYPSQLVESLKNLFIFTTLFSLKDKKLPKGFLFWLFVTMYGILRFLVEFIREPDKQLGFILGPFTMGQILSSVMAITGSIALVFLWKKR